VLRRGISQLLALFIIVVIVVAAALIAGGVVGRILGLQTPKGSVLMLVGFKWASSGSRIVVEGFVTNEGVDSVNITGMYAWVNGEKYRLDMEPVNVKPGEEAELIGDANVTNLPKLSDILVEVFWCNRIQCGRSVAHAKLISGGCVLETKTITVPVPGWTATIIAPAPPATTTYTTTAPITATTTTTVTTTCTTTITSTTTATATITTTTTTTITATTTAIITKPSWPVQFGACYSVDNYIYVWGVLQKPISEKESIPYIVRIYRCSLLGCTQIGAVPFAWESNRTFQARFGPVQVDAFHTLKVEVWSTNWYTGQLIQKIWEETVDTHTRCA